MPVWKLVHILGMFAAFWLLLVPLYLQIGVGLVGGVVTMNTAGWSETSPWLLATYALLILVAVLDGGVLGPWRKRVERALSATASVEPPCSALVALLRSRRPVSYAWATTLALIAIVWLMVLKPSFGL